MKRTVLSTILLCIGVMMMAQTPFGKGQLKVSKVARNAVRIQYMAGDCKSPATNKGVSPAKEDLPDWLYVKHDEVESQDISTLIDAEGQTITIKDKNGKPVFKATQHQLIDGVATLSFDSPEDEFLFGLGQFQDGYSNVRGLSRRLTQVNTQISMPMVLSNLGYGVLWNNYGMTEFNPSGRNVRLERSQETGVRSQENRPEAEKEVVNVTTTEGNKKEVRERHIFEAEIDIEEAGMYALLLDVGQKMARRHNLCIDGVPVIEMQNLWLPPTASKIVLLDEGRHKLTAELTKDDQPTVYYHLIKDETVFRSSVATAVDYTVFVGTPDEIIATFRELTGPCPQIPKWALGYIHCRERFHSSQEILETANRFKAEQMPVSMLVQDWQWWGKHGWNAMQFDEDNYPDPKALTDGHQADA